MSEPAQLHLALPFAPARDAVATALAEQGFTVQPVGSGSLDVSRGSLGTTLVAGAFAGQDMHVRFDVHFAEEPGGTVASFAHSAVGGFFKGGAIGAAKAADTVREAAHLAGTRLAQLGVLQGSLPAPAEAPTPGQYASADATGLAAAAPAAAAEGAPTPPPPAPGYPGAPYPGAAYPGAASATVPPPVDYANRTNVVAIIAIIAGFVFPLAGIIAGAVGLAQIKRTGEKGRGLALTGVIVGSVLTALAVLGGIALFAFLAIAGATAGDDEAFIPPSDSQGGVLQLRVGQCLDDVSTGVVTSDDIVDCAQPHTYEVFGDIPVPGSTFPGTDTVDTAAQEDCDAAFTGYVGIAYADSSLDYSYLVPTAQTWAGGDRQISCLLTDPAGEVTGSLAGSAR